MAELTTGSGGGGGEVAERRPVVAIAGATGFVGTALLAALTERYDVVGLTRSPVRAERPPRAGIVRWRHCDLYSLLQVEQALDGVDYAIYLVHSMSPSARLVQASFADLDLILADNFARAAERAGVRQIVYLGGLMPEEGQAPSEHLRSRFEVEQTLGGRTVPVTALRAGLIVGPGGTSLRILLELVRRLPVMVLPSWTESESRPIAVRDVVRAVLATLGDPASFGRSYDLGGPERLSYAEMIARVAALLGRRRKLLRVPFFAPQLSVLWVALVTRSPIALVGPLVESLRCSLELRDDPLSRRLVAEAQPFDEALRASVDARGRPLPNPRVELRPLETRSLREGRTVRSVQRMPCPQGRDALWVAFEYMRWLPRFVWPLLTAQVEAQRVVRFHVTGLPRLVLLELTHAPERSAPDRQLFYITGGLLARDAAGPGSPGRLEFREVLGSRAIIAAIHDFRPALPWVLYQWTQAVVHLWVMRGFRRHLGRVPPHPTLPAEAARPGAPEADGDPRPAAGPPP